MKMLNPIAKFQSWWIAAQSNSPLKQKNAICVSTIGKDGFPNARFVDLKAVDDGGFTFCSYYDSEKGKEILRTPKIAMTVWWDHVGYQVRVVGNASKISEQEANKHWNSRSAEAQLITSVSAQSDLLKSESALKRAVEIRQSEVGSHQIERPENWGGYLVVPKKIEFLTFREDRLHLREQFTQTSDCWEVHLLQP